MEAPATTPKGFCPKCYYPIDPGVCPECGTDVTAETILSSLSQTRAAKARRWTIRVLLISGAITGLVWGGLQIPWPRFMPTSWLLSWQPDAKRWESVYAGSNSQPPQSEANYWATGELLRRFVAGRLSKDEARRFVDRLVLIQIQMRRTSPQHLGLPYFITVRQLIPASSKTSLGTKVQFNSVLLDGRPCQTPFSSIDASGAGSSSTGAEIMPLSVGRHEIEFAVTAVTTETTTPLDSPTAIADHRIKRVVDVKELPASQFVRRKCDSRLTSRLQTNLTVQIESHLQALKFQLAAPLDVPVAGRILVRRSGQDEFTDIGKVGLDRFFTFAYLEKFRSVPKLDVRLEPDAAAAIEHLPGEATAFYGCPIEWDGVTAESARTPTRIGAAIPNDGSVGEQRRD